MMFVLVYSGCYNNIPKTVAYKQQKFMSHSSGVLNFEIRVPAWLSKAPTSGSQTSHHILTCGRCKDLFEAPFIRSLFPFINLHPLDLPKAPPSNSIILLFKECCLISKLSNATATSHIWVLTIQRRPIQVNNRMFSFIYF